LPISDFGLRRLSSSTLRRSISPSLILLSLAVFLLALVPRLGALDRYVTPDELRWVDRSLHFANALSQGDLASTIQSGHPGITTMWLGSLGIRLSHVMPTALPDFDPQNAEVARFLAQYLTAARWPVIFVVAINLVALFLLLDRLIDRRAAFLAAGLIALDPFAVALGGILHVDALLTIFCLNSLAALCVALNRPRPTRWLILSGMFAGLAMLSKSPGAILGVATLIILAADDLRQRRSILHTIKALFLWGIAAALTFILLAPSMWVQPIGTLQLMSSTAEKFSETAHTVNYFNGSYDRDPGPLFYPAVLAFRSTPILWLGLIAGIILIVRAKSEHDRRLRSIAWTYWVFALVFLGVITLGAKKLDRYMLPALDALYIVSALGLAFVIEQFDQRPSTASLRDSAQDARRKWLLNGAVVALLLISAIQLVPVWPLTLRAYNPLLGGYDAAQAVLPVGGGESAEVGQALRNASPVPRIIAVSDVIGTAPYYVGDLVPNTAAGLALADSILFTASDFQLTPDVTRTWIGSATPGVTITVQGQPYAWLYPNQWLAAQQQRFQEKYQSGDVLLTDALANVPVPTDAVQVISSEIDETAAMQLLQQIAQSHQRVWVTHYTASPRRLLNPLSRLLDTYAVQLDEWSTPLSDGALYTLPDQFSFTTQSTPLNGAATFGDRVQLNSAELIVPRVQPGQSIGLAGEWAATGSDAQAIVALIDAAGHQWSAGDAPVPLGDTTRTRRISVPVPLTIPPGEYQLVLNVIDVASGSPLSTRRADGLLGGIDWPLGSIVIDPAQTPIDPATRRPPITLNAGLGGLRAIGTETPPDPIVGGDPWTLSMEWLAQADQLPALDVQWELTQNDHVVYSNTLPLNPYSTEKWRAGDVLQSKYDFRLPFDVPAGKYDLQFKVIDRATGRPFTDRAVKVTQVNIASRPRTFAAPAVAYPLDAKFGELAKLLGANMDRSGSAISVTLYWQANAITTTNFTAFVQLIGTNDQVRQQIDNWQIAFDAPTSTWIPGQVIADQYVFEVSSDAATIGVGLYNAATGERLPAFAGSQRLPQDRVVIK
jgi:4-amino-4-deoxy-L-arabinose transferase-like glycosyltransferase